RPSEDSRFASWRFTDARREPRCLELDERCARAAPRLVERRQDTVVPKRSPSRPAGGGLQLQRAAPPPQGSRRPPQQAPARPHRASAARRRLGDRTPPAQLGGNHLAFRAERRVNPGMAWLSLGLSGLWGVLGLGVRTWLHRRRTGRSPLRHGAGPRGSLAVLGVTS